MTVGVVVGLAVGLEVGLGVGLGVVVVGVDLWVGDRSWFGIFEILEAVVDDDDDEVGNGVAKIIWDLSSVGFKGTKVSKVGFSWVFFTKTKLGKLGTRVGLGPVNISEKDLGVTWIVVSSEMSWRFPLPDDVSQIISFSP